MTNYPIDDHRPADVMQWLQDVAELEQSWRPFEEQWEFYQKVYADWDEKTEALVKERMENVFPLRVPLKVHLGWGANWAEAK